MSDTPTKRIEPEAFTPANAANNSSTNSASQPPEAYAQYSPASKKVLNWAVPAVLAVIALVLVLYPLLPSPSETLETPILEQSELAQPQLNQPDETPWADAQLLKARREAQEILAELIGVQNRLEAALAEVWAYDEFETMKSIAELGDDLYQERQFDSALENYQNALDKALNLDAAIPHIAKQYREDGIRLLSQNHILPAIESLELSEKLIPASEITAQALAQARVREQILELIDRSNSLSTRDSNIESARQSLVDAQALDPLYSPIQDLLAEIDLQIIDRDFLYSMSEGFQSLSSGAFERATKAFDTAFQLKPNNPAAKEALQQVEAAKLNSRRQASLTKAIDFEASEQWASALSLYTDLLNEDSSLSAANIGKLRSDIRFKLDASIEDILGSPLDLQAESKWRAANSLLADARGIINSGPRLQAQIDSLEKLLRNARTPVILKLQSDNQTDVEIYRVGKLGTFSEQAMNLNPGNYVIVGRKIGFHDVRIELAIDGSSSEVTIPVVCSIAI